MTRRKAAAEKAHSTYRKSAPKAPARRRTVHIAEEFVRDAQMPESMRTLAEKSVVQTRALCEHAESSVALNRKAIDIARHNINTGFGFAVSLARAKNLAEVMELQAVYWRKQLGELAAQAGEMRTLSTMTADVAAPIRAQVTRGIKGLQKAT